VRGEKVQKKDQEPKGRGKGLYTFLSTSGRKREGRGVNTKKTRKGEKRGKRQIGNKRGRWKCSTCRFPDCFRCRRKKEGLGPGGVKC